MAFEQGSQTSFPELEAVLSIVSSLVGLLAATAVLSDVSPPCDANSCAPKARAPTSATAKDGPTDGKALLVEVCVALRFSSASAFAIICGEVGKDAGAP